MIRIVLPPQLRTLARVEGEVEVELHGEVLPTQATLLDALEARFPVLTGAIRDRHTGRRRPYLRFFACACDLSHELPDTPLPPPVAGGSEPFLIIGAMSGG